jgi:hypothetical protein
MRRARGAQDDETLIGWTECGYPGFAMIRLAIRLGTLRGVTRRIESADQTIWQTTAFLFKARDVSAEEYAALTGPTT